MRPALAAGCVLAAAACLAVLLAGCGGSRGHAAPVPSRHPAASPAAPGAAFCGRLAAARDPQAVYAGEVERQVALAGGGTVTPGVISAARTVVALWITISCPRFARLEQGG